MRKTLGVFLLVLLFTGSASAGIIGNDSPAPPAQPASAVQEPTQDGEIQHPQMTDGIIQNEAGMTFAQVLLNLLALS
jgi:hypothetical protein